ncbi:MAG: prepilin-type N-terminal cleavage/methylation domain-containing protein [Azoarcus sp.]|jgi:type IV pilus assembly protein PilW|nr:prepilin-type N-terminal cleavage/methylation domain-containing protein [Azoarcus sp.]
MTGKRAIVARWRFPAPFRRHAGMTLIELMIAMLLGLIVIGGVLGIFAANNETGRRTDDIARIQESARIALELMARSLREAGGNVCGSAPASISLVGLAKTDWWTGGEYFLGAITGYDDNDVFPANGSVTRASGSDAFIAISATAGATAVTNNSPLTVYSAAGFVSGGRPVLFACNNGTGEGFIFRPDSIASNVINATIPKNVDTVAGVNAEAWFVGVNPRGGTSLYRTEFTSDPEEIAPDVEKMTLGYLLQGGSTYLDANGVGGEWDKVIAVRIGLTLARATAAASGAPKITRNVAHVVTLRNRNPSP